MAKKASHEEIERVLKDMREAIQAEKFVFVKRRKNIDTLTELGLMPEDIPDEFMDLSCSEYIKGPEQDRDRKESDCFWIFKKKISWQVIYIKFKVEYQIDGGVKVVSFHIDEDLPSN